ncbi:hypothetical protein ACO0RG_002455 [Hanseniaspora osmophila]
MDIPDTIGGQVEHDSQSSQEKDKYTSVQSQPDNIVSREDAQDLKRESGTFTSQNSETFATEAAEDKASLNSSDHAENLQQTTDQLASKDLDTSDVHIPNSTNSTTSAKLQLPLAERQKLPGGSSLKKSPEDDLIDSGDSGSADTHEEEDEEEDEEEGEGTIDSEEDEGEDTTDSEEDEGEDGDDDEDEEGESEPPALKYTRIKQFPEKLFQRDSISSCLFHESLFAFGTHSGVLHLMKPATFETIRSFKCHRASIMNITTQGTYFATASIDGTVIIGSLEDPTELMACDFSRPVNFVVLDPDYQASKKFVSGGMSGDVMLSSRNWLGNRVDTVLDKGHGPVVGIYIVNDILFWMNDRGITFISISSKTKLLNIPFPYKDKRPDLYWPSVHFPETDRIIISWYDHVWFFKVEILKDIDRTNGQTLGSILSSAASSLRALPDKKIEMEYHAQLQLRNEEVIVDISSFKDEQLIYLAASNAQCPELKIYDISLGEEQSSAEIPMRNYKSLNYNDYHMGKYLGNRGAANYYIVSSIEVIVAKELTLKDRFDWYMETKDYYKAWEIGFHLDPMDRLELGLKYIELLKKQEKYKDAIFATTKIFQKTIEGTIDDEQENEFFQLAVSKWTNILMSYLSLDLYDLVAANIPQGLGIDHALYDKILLHYLKCGHIEKFTSLLHTWPDGSFDISCIIDAMNNMERSRPLKKELAYLYHRNKDYLHSVDILLSLKDMQALDILLSHPIFANFTNKIHEIVLLPISSQAEPRDVATFSLKEIKEVFAKPLRLLVENRYSISLKSVIAQLEKDPQTCPVLYAILNRVSKKDPLLTANFEDAMISLFTKNFVPRDDSFDLLNFLKTHRNYSVDQAIVNCENSTTPKVKELIYLWSRIGEWEKALFILLDHSADDPKTAISFVKEHTVKAENMKRASELWDVLIEYSLDKPDFIKAILLCSDSSSDDCNSIDNKAKITLIERLSDSQQIPGLQNSITQLLINQYLASNVNGSVLSIVTDEASDVANKYLKQRTRGKMFG